MDMFQKAVERTLGHEGNYVNNPADPGGETNWGISKRAYPTVDIKNLTRDQAIAIYKRDFWDACGMHLHSSLMFQAFDAAVNHGIGNAVRLMQRAIGTADDGHWGPNSISQYIEMDHNDVLMLFLAERQEFMCKLKTFDEFGRGWSRRIAQNLRYAAEDN